MSTLVKRLIGCVCIHLKTLGDADCPRRVRMNGDRPAFQRPIWSRHKNRLYTTRAYGS